MPVIRNMVGVIVALKNKPRRGWVDHRVDNPETVWEHMEHVRDLSYTLGKKHMGQRSAKICAEMGKWHDVIEGIVPDITPFMGITKAQKHELEVMAIDHIGSFNRSSKLIREVWFEYEDQQSAEARFVKKIDVLSMAYRALTYELTNRSPYSLQEFWNYTAKHMEGSPLMEEWQALHALRPEIDPTKPILIRAPNETETYESIRKTVLDRIGQRDQKRSFRV